MHEFLDATRTNGLSTYFSQWHRLNLPIFRGVEFLATSYAGCTRPHVHAVRKRTRVRTCMLHTPIHTYVAAAFVRRNGDQHTSRIIYNWRRFMSLRRMRAGKQARGM